MLLGNSALDLITVSIKVYSRARHCQFRTEKGSDKREL
jgi:hypothetical protein